MANLKTPVLRRKRNLRTKKTTLTNPSQSQIEKGVLVMGKVPVKHQPLKRMKVQLSPWRSLSVSSNNNNSLINRLSISIR
jgi:hypothetical protein